MGFYQFKKEQVLKTDMETAWDFISSPENLKVITPDEMDFNIISEDLPKKIYPGMIIEYRVRPVLKLKMTWVTEITQVIEGQYFIDEQRKGPYTLWHHQHWIYPTNEGVLMKDIVSYIPPMGLLGNLANALIIQKKLEHIFAYRKKVLDNLFNKD